jgi:hypothetical protein
MMAFSGQQEYHEASSSTTTCPACYDFVLWNTACDNQREAEG